MTGRADIDMMGSMQRFVDDDPGYRRWLADHPNGFLINTGRTPSAAYLVLHRASCGTIRGTPARGSTFTGDYAKVCGDRDELESFARELGGVAKPCGLCLGQVRHPDGPSPARGRYGPPYDHLVRSPGNRVRMTFAEVESLVGPLPNSARLHRAWWANGSNVEAQAWRDAGWLVDSVNQAAEEVVFVRGTTGRVQRARGEVTDRRGAYIDGEVVAGLIARAGALNLDAAKLVRLVEELNDNYSRGNAYAAHALLRAILDHIPPMLGCRNFEAVTTNYSWGKTDKNYARRLCDFRLQADDALHRQISRRTDLLGMDDMPPKIWVNRVLQECAS